MRMNANEITYEEATLFGQPVLFTNYRIDRATVPPQLNLYELRHEDENSGRPCELAEGILATSMAVSFLWNRLICPRQDIYP